MKKKLVTVFIILVIIASCISGMSLAFAEKSFEMKNEYVIETNTFSDVNYGDINDDDKDNVISIGDFYDLDKKENNKKTEKDKYTKIFIIIAIVLASITVGLLLFVIVSTCVRGKNGNNRRTKKIK